MILVVSFICLLLADWGSFSISVNGSDIIDLVCLAIFIFIIFFICSFKSWSKSARKNIITCIVVYCCLNVFTVWSNFGIMCIKRDYEGSSRKACWNNLRFLNGAVEMYNMDNKVMMENFDFKSLFNGGYIKEEFSFPSRYCYYTNFDNLTENGFVCCNKHFSPDTELGYSGYWIVYDDLNKDNYKNYLGRDCKVTFEKFNELREKFMKMKDNTDDYQEQRNLVIEENKKIRAKKPFLERARLHFKENRNTYIDYLYPIIVLFFPYVLHPLR